VEFQGQIHVHLLSRLHELLYRAVEPLVLVDHLLDVGMDFLGKLSSPDLGAFQSSGQ